MKPSRPRRNPVARCAPFTDITGRFDVKAIDLVVFGGQVPPDRKAELREEIEAINAQVIFVQGLAGTPGLIVNQVRGAFTANHQDRASLVHPDESEGRRKEKL